MNRSDVTLIGCGGGGNKIVDAIMDTDPRFVGYFINTSTTDIQSLNNYDDIATNFLCISSQQNGMGRNRILGKRYASKHGAIILDTINNFSQKTVFLFTSLGGGSGSSIVSVILNAINNMEDGTFDKTINLVGILPKLSSAKEILKNTIDAWNELLSYKCINNMIFIDNNNTFDGEYLSEEEINARFAEMFDAIFEIPSMNGTNFDNGNLGNILNSEGCMYIYDLPSDCENVEQALKIADKESILAKMYETEDNTEISEDGHKRIICEYLGTSFNDEKYYHEELLLKYKCKEEDYQGFNDSRNLVLISGCYPPLYSIQVIETELEDRKKEEVNHKKTDFSKFKVNANKPDNNGKTSKNENQQNKPVSPQERAREKSKMVKKSMKKNLFDMF